MNADFFMMNIKSSLSIPYQNLLNRTMTKPWLMFSNHATLLHLTDMNKYIKINALYGNTLSSASFHFEVKISYQFWLYKMVNLISCFNFQ